MPIICCHNSCILDVTNHHGFGTERSGQLVGFLITVHEHSVPLAGHCERPCFCDLHMSFGSVLSAYRFFVLQHGPRCYHDYHSL